jgi:hypothetical protein
MGILLRSPGRPRTSKGRRTGKWAALYTLRR